LKFTNISKQKPATQGYW